MKKYDRNISTRRQFAHPKKIRRPLPITDWWYEQWQHQDRSKYVPHQGAREKARRMETITPLNRGALSP
jgi:hypothetical protein